MMNNSITQVRPLTEEQIRSLDTETLRRHLAQALVVTAKTLSYLAAIWRELESRGEDLTSLKGGLAHYLPAIANGTLDAEIVVKYAGQKTLLSAMSKIPLIEQREILERGTVPVGKIKNGEVTKEYIEPFLLSSRDVRFVFSDSGVRPLSEQLELRKKAERFQKRLIPSASHPLQSGVVRIGEHEFTAEQVLTALSNYYGFDVKNALLSKGSNKKKVANKGTGPVLAVRDALDLTQKEFAVRLGVSFAAVCQWEKKGQWPGLEIFKRELRKLAAEAGVDLSEWE